jgi:hypothetical protein
MMDNARERGQYLKRKGDIESGDQFKQAHLVAVQESQLLCLSNPKPIDLHEWLSEVAAFAHRFSPS